MSEIPLVSPVHLTLCPVYVGNFAGQILPPNFEHKGRKVLSCLKYNG